MDLHILRIRRLLLCVVAVFLACLVLNTTNATTVYAAPTTVKTMAEANDAKTGIITKSPVVSGDENVILNQETAELLAEYKKLQAQSIGFNQPKYTQQLPSSFEKQSVDWRLGFICWMVSIAEDDSHGYCQYAKEKVPGGISAGRNLNPDVDCSSFVYYGLLNNGYNVFQLGITPFTTRTMDEILTNIGFEKIEYTDNEELIPGDILWRTGHTEVYIGSEQNVGACIAETGEINGLPGDQTGREVRVKKTGTDWEYVYRNTKELVQK